MKYRFFVFLFFFNLNYQENFWDILTNAYNEPLSFSFFINNKIATIGGMLFIGCLFLQTRTMNHILKEDTKHSELLSKKRNQEINNISDEETDNEGSDDIEKQLNKEDFSETEFNKKTSQGCLHYLLVSFKESLNPFQWLRSN